MSQHPPRYDWDYSDYARLPDDGNRYEVIGGELLVTPAPSTDHQHVLANLMFGVKKPRRDGDFGVPEYWVVDPEERVVWVQRFAAGAAEAERVAGTLNWQPEGAASAFETGPEGLFRPTW